MKRVILVAFVIAIAVAVILMRVLSSSDTEKARRAENTGDYATALSYYISTILEATSSVSLLDPERARLTSMEDWIGEIAAYAGPIRAREDRQTPDLRSAVESAVSCTSRVQQQNRLVHHRVIPAGVDTFRVRWKDLFFPVDVELPESQQNYADDARGFNCSFLILVTKQSYTYDAHLVDPTTATRVNVTLFPESETTLLVHPGTYYLTCVSSATFPSGEIWRSSPNMLAIEIPDSSCIVTATVQTRVKRQ